jgi:hypothetical protein
VFEISFFRLRLDDDEAIWIFKGETVQEKSVDQAEDRRVHADPEGEGDDGKDTKAGRLQELAEGEAKVIHGGRMFVRLNGYS